MTVFWVSCKITKKTKTVPALQDEKQWIYRVIRIAGLQRDCVLLHARPGK